MKLFKLETPGLWLPDEINMMLVWAHEQAARNIASSTREGHRKKNEYTGLAATCVEICSDGNAAVCTPPEATTSRDSLILKQPQQNIDFYAASRSALCCQRSAP
jgi:hypothetical protein